jgi:hypothetical protein
MPRVSHPVRPVLSLGLAALAALGPPSIGHAQDRGAPPTGLFSSAAPLKFTLQMPYSQVLNSKRHPEYSDGRLLYKDSAGADVAVDLRIRVRGKSRVEACSFPPLLLNFPAKALDGTWFDGENKLKLVTHCEQSQMYEKYQAIEYTAYRVLDLLTDMTLRVRPVEVTYYDSKKEREVTTKPGFLIEDEARFAARHGLHVVTTEEPIDRSRYDPAALALVDMFQYFLGNTDWSALQGPKGDECCHNVVPMAREDGTLVPIPYDFDSTGIVNPPYALPALGLPIRNVRTRLYRGACRDPKEVAASYEPFQKHRAEILALFDQQQERLGKTADSVRSYIDDFYETLASTERAERAFRVNCPR